MIADAVKIDLKVLAAARSPVALERAIPVFHRWIQERSLDELMVDVADYTHVPDGPGVVLVCHDAIYSLDSGGGALGLLYSRRRETHASLGPIASLDDRLASVFRRALVACGKLERERDLAGLSFPADRFELAINDRRVSAADGGELARALERLAAWLFAGEHPRIEVTGGDGGARLAATLHRDRAPRRRRAVVAARRRRRGEGVMSRAGSQASPGKVWIVGAGPGDPELLTVRAARLIAEADDLVVDALVAPEIYRGAPGRVIYVGKRAGRPRPSQRRIEEILVQLARERRRVVRLKGGDPSLFARLAEEVQALEAAGVPYEIVPGVSSLLAVPLAAGIPLTDRDAADRVVIMTGHRSAEGSAEPAVDLPRYDDRTTYVLFMGLSRLGRARRRGDREGVPARSARGRGVEGQPSRRALGRRAASTPSPRARPRRRSKRRRRC